MKITASVEDVSILRSLHSTTLHYITIGVTATITTAATTTATTTTTTPTITTLITAMTVTKHYLLPIRTYIQSTDAPTND